MVSVQSNSMVSCPDATRAKFDEQIVRLFSVCGHHFLGPDDGGPRARTTEGTRSVLSLVVESSNAHADYGLDCAGDDRRTAKVSKEISRIHWTYRRNARLSSLVRKPSDLFVLLTY